MTFTSFHLFFYAFSPSFISCGGGWWTRSTSATHAHTHTPNPAPCVTRQVQRFAATAKNVWPIENVYSMTEWTVFFVNVDLFFGRRGGVRGPRGYLYSVPPAAVHHHTCCLFCVNITNRTRSCRVQCDHRWTDPNYIAWSMSRGPRLGHGQAPLHRLHF